MEEFDANGQRYDVNVVWQPQIGPQEALVACPITLVGYGGARGGGKTDGVLGKFAVKQEQLGVDFNAIFFRKELPQADDLIERAKQIYLPLNAHYQDQKKQFTFPKGGRLRFRPLANDSDAEKFQGQNLCVAFGTRIRMADGSCKPIEAIKVGDMVATLLGPRKVKHVTTPYFAPCVESQVLAQDGTLVGVQKNPIWHPVLTAHGVSSTAANYEQHTSQKRHIDEQSLQWALSACSEDYKSLSCEDPMRQAWFSWKEDKKTYCKGSLDDSLEKEQLQSLSVPVTLHAQTVQLTRKREHCCHAASTECHVPDKSCEPLLDSCLMKQKIRQGFEQLDELFQPVLGSLYAPCHAPSNVPTTKQTAANFQCDCPFCRGLCGEHFPQAVETCQGGLPSQDGAAELSHTLNEDELGTIQKHNPEHLEWWVHPYSGKAFRLAEDVVFGKMVMTYVGQCLVTDLTVEEANHYISDCGLINKNSDCAIEEAGNYSDPSPIWKLFGALRGRGNGQIILTFNPGGVGHHWLKELFIKPAPKGMKILKKELPNGKHFEYIYIPSRVHDNQILLSRDPEYIDRLHMVGSPELVRAWLEGDFEIHEGSYFPEFSSRHIISPFNVPKHWPRYLGFDWGYRSPFAAIWGAVSSGRDDKGNEVPYPKGSIIIYRELWGKGVDNKEQANRIASLSVGENPIAVADPSIFSEEGGPSINDQFNAVFSRYNHPSFRRADNERVSGWSQIRQRLVAKPALLYIFSSCPYLLETLPSLAIDKRNAEDADTSGNDHACLTGDTLVITDSGARPIKDLCTGSLVRVLSHDGKFHDAFGAKTRENARVVELAFDDGHKITLTPDHRLKLRQEVNEPQQNQQWWSVNDYGNPLFENIHNKIMGIGHIQFNAPSQDVYCLNVPDTSTFVLANGVVSHNCDALRYLCKARLLEAKWEQPAEVLNKGVIKLQAYIDKMRKHQRRPQI